MEQMEMSIKTEVEMAATFVVHSDSEINVKFFKQDPGLLQSVKSEPSFANDALVKEEILEDSTQDEREQQSVYGAPTPAATGGVNKACSTSLGDLLNVKYESTEMEIGPTLPQDMDTYYTINKSAATEENTKVDVCNEVMPGDRVNEASVEDELRDDSKQQCAQDASTVAGAVSLYEANDLSHSDCLIVKQELENIDIGPTILQHMDIHYTLNKNIADDCNRTMPNYEVNKSMEDKLRGNKIKCNSCGQMTTDYDEAHMKSCMGLQKGLQQDLLHQHQTSTKFKLKSDMTSHLRRHTGEKTYQCDTCNASFAHSGHLTTHKRVHTGEKTYQCDTCNVSFAHSGHLTTHKRVHTGEKQYQCDTCNASFAHSGHLTTHKRVHTGEKPYQCDTCNASFAQSGPLTTHKRVHTGEKPYQCDTCNARFTTSGALTTHKRVHTGTKPYQCDTCNARFRTSGALTAHKRVHTGEKLYQCDTCNARVTTSGALTIHKRVHTGEKPYQCDTCNARFTSSGHLTRHQRVHTGKKPYQCDTCNARFTTNGALTTHKRVHTGEKPYQCDTCNARFKSSRDLTKHQRVHTSEKPYQCDSGN